MKEKKMVLKTFFSRNKLVGLLFRTFPSQRKSIRKKNKGNLKEVVKLKLLERRSDLFRVVSVIGRLQGNFYR